jgi:hypothetical protein
MMGSTPSRTWLSATDYAACEKEESSSSAHKESYGRQRDYLEKVRADASGETWDATISNSIFHVALDGLADLDSPVPCLAPEGLLKIFRYAQSIQRVELFLDPAFMTATFSRWKVNTRDKAVFDTPCCEDLEVESIFPAMQMTAHCRCGNGWELTMEWFALERDAHQLHSCVCSAKLLWL